MVDSLRSLFSSDGFMPHGMCYLWRPGVLGLHVVSDSLITFAYFTIPFTLLYFVRKRSDLQFNWMFVCFAIFIVACGTTHLMEIWTIWHPSYWLSGSIKAITALASVPTAFLLMRLVPKALLLPSPASVQRANTALEKEVAERTRAEAEVRRANIELEAGVARRTAQLEAANGKLLREIAERQRAEEQLKANQQLLQAIIDNSQPVIYAKDLDGRYLLANRRYEQIFGLTSSAILGKTDHDLFSREAADAFRAVDQRVAAAGTALTEEETAPQEDGPHTYISVKAPLRDAAGRMYAVFGVSTDITERKRAEQALRESEERFRTLSESLPHLVWTCRPDGWCDYLSRQWVEYTGRPEQEQLGYGWAERLHPEDRERVQGEWSAATERGDYFDIEFRIRGADSEYRWFKTRAVPLRNALGGIVKWFGSNTNIEDQKRSEARLRAQLERLNLLDQTTRAIGERQDLRSIFHVVLRSLEDHLPVDFACVCLGDADQPALSVSCVGPASHTLAAALSLDEQALMPVDQNGLARCLRGALVYESDVSASRFPFPSRLARAGLRAVVIAPLSVESRVFGVVIAARREAGSFASGECEFLRQLSQHVALAAHQAQLHGALQAAYDDLRQTQQTIMQQERLRALGQMASGIAHDINNALSPASLYAQSLLECESSLTQEGRDHLVVIQRAIDDVAHTVARMKEFYRAREREFPVVPVRLNDILGQVIELTHARWSDIPQERGIVINVATELAAELPAITGAESEIRDGFTNLVLNAVDAMPEGGTLTLRSRVLHARATQGAAQRVAVEVCDTGVGMSEQVRRQCLEPFFTTKGERGTGLGLAMVYGMAERHGAAIEIESEPGSGTTMRLVFPVASPGAPRDTVPRADRRPAQRLSILLIDDDPLLLRSLRTTLERDGHIITAAEGGQAGIDSFFEAAKRGEGFTVVITDLGMPYVDGRTVAAAIKAHAPDTPVLLLTGWGHRLIDENDIPANVDRVLSKPPKLDEVRAALAEVTKRATPG